MNKICNMHDLHQSGLLKTKEPLNVYMHVGNKLVAAFLECSFSAAFELVDYEGMPVLRLGVVSSNSHKKNIIPTVRDMGDFILEFRTSDTTNYLEWEIVT